MSKLWEQGRLQGKSRRADQAVAEALAAGKTVMAKHEGQWCKITMVNGERVYTRCDPPRHGSEIKFM